MHFLGRNIISVAESSNLALAGNYLDGRDWRVCTSNHVLMMYLRHLLSTISVISRDEILWDDHKVIKISDIWNSIRSRSENIQWHDLVWHKLIIPKAAFLMRLIMEK